MFAPARKGTISCAVKSNAKNLRELGKERRLIFLWLVVFSRRGTGYEILTSSVYVFTTESHLPLAGHALTFPVSFLKLFQSTEPNLISGGRQKGGWANGCHSIFCKKLVSFCLSAQERLITTGINGRDPFNQNSNRSDLEKRTTSKGEPVFSKLFRLDRTVPLSFGPKFPESLVEWIAPNIRVRIWVLQWEGRKKTAAHTC